MSDWGKLRLEAFFGLCKRLTAMFADASSGDEKPAAPQIARPAKSKWVDEDVEDGDIKVISLFFAVRSSYLTENILIFAGILGRVR
jgi:hypothetical protein